MNQKPCDRMSRPASLAQEVCARLRRVVGQAGSVALHEPYLEGNAWEYVRQCLDTGWVSSVGQYVDQFESLLAEYTGVARAVAVVNGTAALHLALRLVGVGPDDEVLCPALSFVATANAISYCGATPHFVDIEERTLGIDPFRLDAYLRELVVIRDGAPHNRQTGRLLRAIVPMHTFGHPVDMDPLLEVASRYRLVVVEDAAESLGSQYKGRHTGSLGRIAAVSFNGNKIVTTGGGGAILTNDLELANRAKHVSTTAKVPHRWKYDHDQLGFNYRLPNLNAALGCAQLELLPEMLAQKRSLAEEYQRVFREVQGISVFREAGFATSNYWLNVLLLDESESAHLEEILEATNEDGIMTRPAWTLLSDLPMYRNCPAMPLPTSRSVQTRAINVPSSVNLGHIALQKARYVA